jgi:hypothetical protein
MAGALTCKMIDDYRERLISWLVDDFDDWGGVGLRLKMRLCQTVVGASTLGPTRPPYFCLFRLCT